MEALIQRRPHVMLEWDSARNKVVAPRSQVAISWAQASGDSTKSACSHSEARLVDRFGISEELLELSNLNNILSLETWEICLTHSERELLSMYFPDGVDPESTVEALLTGENFHFGNPLETWGEFVCSGAMHPDAILHREMKFKEERKAYSKRLRNYHGNMIHNLRNFKEIWEECGNPEDFLPQIERFGTSGQRSHRSHRKNVSHPSSKTVDKADLKKRHWNEVGEGIDQVRDMSTRPKIKKQKVNNLPDEGSKRLKIKPVESETEKLNIKPSEGPTRVKIKPIGETTDIATRLKGSNVGQPEEGTKTTPKMKTSDVGTKRLKVKSPEERAKRPVIKPLQEGRKKGQLKPLQEETGRLKMKSSDEAAERPEMKMPQEGVKESKMKPSEEWTKRLKLKPSGYGRKQQEIKPAEEGSRRLQIKPVDKKMDTAIRSTAKRLKVKPSDEGTKRLEYQHAEEGTKKPQIRPSEAGRKTQHPEEDNDLPNRPKAKRSKVKASEDEATQRPKIKLSEERSKSLKIKPSREAPKVLKMKASEEVAKTLQVKVPRGGKGLKIKPLEEAAQRPKINPPEENELFPRPREKRSKVKASEQGTKKLKIKHTKEGQEERDLGHSDFEGEWFKKFVQVTMGPVSGHRFSKAIQSVKVTTKMFKDVKRRSEAGEEVHLDTLVHVETPSNKKKASKRAGGPNRNEEELVASFWQTVVIKDLPAVHARFMRRKEQLQKLAISLASSCKFLAEIEIDNDVVAQEDASPGQDYASPSADYTSLSPGVPSPGVEYASPSAGEPSLSEHEGSPRGVTASPSGGEASPSDGSASGGDPSASGTDASPSGGEASPTGVDAVPSGDEAWPSGDEASASGHEAMLSGDDALGSGDEASPGEAELEKNWGIKAVRR